MRVYIPLACALMLAACGGSSSGGTNKVSAPTPTPEPTPAPYRCVEQHEAGAGFHIMKNNEGGDLSIEACPDDELLTRYAGEKIQIHNGDVQNKSIKYGKFTGYMTGVGDHDHGVLSFYVILHGNTYNNAQQNFHAGLWGPNPMNNRMVRHSWQGGLDITKTQSNFRFEAPKTYRFEGWWDATQAHLQVCEGGSSEEVATINNCDKVLTQGWVAPMKEFEMQGFMLGNKLLKGFSFGNNVQLKGVRFTLFEEGDATPTPEPAAN